MLEIDNLVRKNMTLACNTQKKNYDHKIAQNLYNVGDLEWLYNPKPKPGKSSKLRCPGDGPWTIIKHINDVIYRIQKTPCSIPRVVHHDRLEWYEGSKS